LIAHLNKNNCSTLDLIEIRNIHMNRSKKKEEEKKREPSDKINKQK
jgi:hypothetical protein